jgi:hypothetical protein
LVVRGLAPAALLDTYEEERRPSAEKAIQFSMELGKVICVPDADEAAARDAAMAAAVGDEPLEAPSLPGLDGGLVHPDAPHAGELFVQGTLGGRPFDDAVGAGWRLVALSPSPTGPDGLDHALGDLALADWFASIGGRLVVLDDPDATHRRWFASRATTWALQRPDFHLYGTATSAAGASALLADLRDRLSAHPIRLQGAPT